MFNCKHKSLKTAFISILTLFVAILWILYCYEILQFNNPWIDPISFELIKVNFDTRRKYVVWSSTCNIPNVSLLHSSILKFVFEWKGITCSSREPLTYTLYNPVTQEYSIIINKTTLSKYEIKDESNVECCYSSISRKNIENQKIYYPVDDRYDSGDLICFKNRIKVPKETEFVYVHCNSTLNSDNNVIFKTVYGMVPIKNNLKMRSNRNETFSVLLLGIDSIARLNMIRTMPKTWQYLKENQWISLEGYNKIGYNTFPNLCAVLTGYFKEEIRKICWKNNNDVFDQCPLIWKEYKQKSYVTAYIEDTPNVGTFNYAKNGFQNNPTDYYPRRLMVAGMKNLETKDDGGMTYCMGELPQAEYLLQYTTEFVKRFHNNSYFNLFWLNSFSHSELNQPRVFDLRYRKFLEDLQPYLNSTIVIFFSDHGMRFGKIRETYAGWLEERLPFLTFRLPPFFKKKFPKKYENLVYNKNRLTSPFDLYATLQDILYGSVPRKPSSCPTCDSLFNKVAFNRSCEQAGIPEYWCTCSSSMESASASDTAVVSNVRFVIDELNKYLRSNQGEIEDESYCAILHLKKVLSARTQTTDQQWSKCDIVFQTTPSNAVFEVTISNRSNFSVETSISRVNAYGDQSSCVKHSAILKNFCFCQT